MSRENSLKLDLNPQFWWQVLLLQGSSAGRAVLGGTVSGCTRLHGWFCTSELGMCNQQELPKWGGPSQSSDSLWGSEQGQSQIWGALARRLLPVPLRGTLRVLQH